MTDTALCRPLTKPDELRLFWMRLPPDLSCIVPPQAVFDFSNSAIALRRHFGEGLTIRQTLDLQLAFEALHGSFRADILSVLNALGKHETHADAAVRYQ